jgi:hypothetical protein
MTFLYSSTPHFEKNEKIHTIFVCKLLSNCATTLWISSTAYTVIKVVTILKESISIRGPGLFNNQSSFYTPVGSFTFQKQFALISKYHIRFKIKSISKSSYIQNYHFCPINQFHFQNSIRIQFRLYSSL